MNDARLIIVIVHGVVQHAAIVPHHQIAGLPGMPRLEFLADGMLEEKFEETAALLARPVDESSGEGATHIKCALAGFIVCPHDRML